MFSSNAWQPSDQLSPKRHESHPGKLMTNKKSTSSNKNQEQRTMKAKFVNLLGTSVIYNNANLRVRKKCPKNTHATKPYFSLITKLSFGKVWFLWRVYICGFFLLHKNLRSSKSENTYTLFHKNIRMANGRLRCLLSLLKKIHRAANIAFRASLFEMKSIYTFTIVQILIPRAWW